MLPAPKVAFQSVSKGARFFKEKRNSEPLINSNKDLMLCGREISFNSYIVIVFIDNLDVFALGMMANFPSGQGGRNDR